MQRYLILSAISLLSLSLYASHEGAQGKAGFCHDLETGEFRPIQEGDQPTSMKPHDTRLEFTEPHLSCTPSHHRE